jgi:hypothetical protein
VAQGSHAQRSLSSARTTALPLTLTLSYVRGHRTDHRSGALLIALCLCVVSLSALCPVLCAALCRASTWATAGRPVALRCAALHGWISQRTTIPDVSAGMGFGCRFRSDALVHLRAARSVFVY